MFVVYASDPSQGKANKLLFCRIIYATNWCDSSITRGRFFFEVTMQDSLIRDVKIIMLKLKSISEEK